MIVLRIPRGMFASPRRLCRRARLTGPLLPAAQFSKKANESVARLSLPTVDPAQSNSHEISCALSPSLCALPDRGRKREDGQTRRSPMKTRKKQLTWTLLCLALVGVSDSKSGAKVGFQPPVTYPVGTAPRAVASGDFNGDGKMDLAIANFGDPNAHDDGGVSILLGNGDGTFQAQKNVVVGKNPCPDLYLPCVIATADYNGDGRLDLAVLNANDTVSVLLGNGDGTFQAHVDYTTGNGAIALRLGDVNGDQRPDLIVLQAGAGSVGILLANGDGTFQNHADHSTGSNPGSLAVLDVNGDGKLDLVMSVGFLGIETLFGNGDGTFQSGVYCSCGSQQKNAFGVAAVGPIEAGDFNGDSRMDLAVLFFDTTDIFHPVSREMVL